MCSWLSWVWPGPTKFLILAWVLRLNKVLLKLRMNYCQNVWFSYAWSVWNFLSFWSIWCLISKGFSVCFIKSKPVSSPWNLSFFPYPKMTQQIKYITERRWQGTTSGVVWKENMQDFYFQHLIWQSGDLEIRTWAHFYALLVATPQFQVHNIIFKNLLKNSLKCLSPLAYLLWRRFCGRKRKEGRWSSML